MPKDKTGTHIRVMEAAMEVFLDKGYDKASIRDIAAESGITSAGLYRHCKDKEDLFYCLVKPAIVALEEWVDDHIKNSYESMEKRDYQGINSQSEIDMIRSVAIPYKNEFKLLITKSGGTKYENFIHDMVNLHEEKMIEGLKEIKAHGYPVKQVDRDELHILISAYITALFEPVIHDYPEDKVDHYLQTIEDFFMPGWHKLLGI